MLFISPKLQVKNQGIKLKSSLAPLISRITEETHTLVLVSVRELSNKSHSTLTDVPHSL